jgi:hypothetical protein
VVVVVVVLVSSWPPSYANVTESTHWYQYIVAAAAVDAVAAVVVGVAHDAEGCEGDLLLLVLALLSII